MAEGFQTSADTKTLKKVLELARASKETPKTKKGALAADFESFLEQLVRFATGEDRYWDEPASLLERAVGAWKATEKRKRGEPALSFRLQKGADWRETRLVLARASKRSKIFCNKKSLGAKSAEACGASKVAPWMFLFCRPLHGRRTANGCISHNQSNSHTEE